MIWGTRTTLFYKKHANKPLSHPLRRWVPFYFIGGAFGGAGAYAVYKYTLLRHEGKKFGDQAGNHLCSSGIIDLLSVLPFNLVSHCFGVLTSDNLLPPAVHHAFISWIVWWHGLSYERGSITKFQSLQSFYARSWEAGERPVSPKAVLVAPCDGTVLSFSENVTGEELVQVKGCTYPMRSLFRLKHPEPPLPRTKRVLVVIRLGMKDYHQVIAPRCFHCRGSVYVPGFLFPISPAWYHYIPGVLTLNERVVLHGSASGSPIFIALVGSTLKGKILLDIDRRVKTNSLDPPDYSIFTTYDPHTLLQKGSPIGRFQWGSTVVLMTDVPVHSNVRVSVGSSVKAGEPLID